METAPTCNTGSLGRVYYNTVTNNSYICTSTGWIQETNSGTGKKIIALDLVGGVRRSMATGTIGGGSSPVLRAEHGENSRSRWSFPVPEDWVTNTDMTVDLKWSPSSTGTGNIYWRLKYGGIANGEVINSSLFTTIDYIQATTATDSELITTSNNFIIPGSSLSAGDMINIHINRQGSLSGDTYLDDINIHQVTIEYTGYG